MSGIDEQNRGFPMCPICEDEPRFWILYPNMAQNSVAGWYWLFSEAYAKMNTRYSELTRMNGRHERKTTLDEIVVVTCSDNNHHQFTADHPLFEKVLRHARKLEK